METGGGTQKEKTFIGQIRINGKTYIEALIASPLKASNSMSLREMLNELYTFNL